MSEADPASLHWVGSQGDGKESEKIHEVRGTAMPICDATESTVFPTSYSSLWAGGGSSWNEFLPNDGALNGWNPVAWHHRDPMDSSRALSLIKENSRTRLLKINWARCSILRLHREKLVDTAPSKWKQRETTPSEEA